LDRFIPERYRHTHRRDMVAFGDDAHRARPMGRQREVTALRADGEEFPVEASISHLTINGQHLFTVIHRDITAQKKAQDDLEYSHAALQRLIAAQDKVQEEERARISRELHDDLQQTLAAIRIDLSALDYGLKKGLDASSSLLPELDALAEQAIVSTRRVIDDLRPKALDEVGLLPALQLLAEQFSQHYGIVCRVDVPEALSERLMKMPSLAMCLYRVTQESLNNVAKHSKATEVLITLVQTPADQVCLRIADNGRGIRSRDRYKPESSGLVGMRERVRAQNGVLRIDGRPGGGTVVEVAVRLDTPSWAEPFDSVTANPPPDATDARDSGFGSPDGDSVRARLDEAQLPRLLGRMASQTLQSVIDALEGSVAVIDRRGIIRFVNRAWLDFGARNGHPVAQSIGPGADYLEACRRAVLTDPSVEAVLQGLVELIEGRRTQFACDYACHSPETLRWFRMQVTPMSNGDILVMHFLLNEEPAGASRAAN
jgi:signal transduction histidine kinase